MSKKNEYPQSKHIVPRVECIIQGFSRAKNFIKLVEKHLIANCPYEDQKKLFEEELESTKEALDLAHQAIVGDENSSEIDS